jgi:hypothetical protein
MAGLEVRVTPADGSDAFEALLVGGYREYEDGDNDNAAVVGVRHLDDHWEPVGEPASNPTTAKSPRGGLSGRCVRSR